MNNDALDVGTLGSYQFVGELHYRLPAIGLYALQEVQQHLVYICLQPTPSTPLLSAMALELMPSGTKVMMEN